MGCYQEMINEAIRTARATEAKGTERPPVDIVFWYVLNRIKEGDMEKIILSLAAFYAHGFLCGEENKNASKSYLHSNNN